MSECVNHLRVLHAEEPNHVFSFPRISNGTQLFQDASALLKANAVGQELIVGGEVGQGVDVEGGQGGDGQEEIGKVYSQYYCRGHLLYTALCMLIVLCLPWAGVIS